MAKQQSFQIKMKDGSTQEVNGLIVNNRWGIDKRLSSFYLTHVPTGALVTNANTQRALKEFINRPDVIEEDNPVKIAKALEDFWNQKGWQG